MENVARENQIHCSHPGAPPDIVQGVWKAIRIPARCGLLVWLSDEEEKGVIATDPRQFAGLFVPPELERVDFSDALQGASKGFAFVIWIARRIVEGPPINLTRNLAHEHRHLQQYLYDRNFYFAGILAYQYLVWLSERDVPGNDYDAPIEWDAEACARQITAALHGEGAVRALYVGTDREIFAAPQAVRPFRETADVVRTWLRERQEGIADALEARGLRETFDLVNWEAFGLPDFNSLVKS